MDRVDAVDREWPAPRQSRLRLHSSVAALSAVVFGDGVDEVLAVKIGPEFWGDVHLGVADLPE